MGLGLTRGIAERGVSLGPGTVLSPSGTGTCDDEFSDSSLDIDSSSKSSESSLSAGLWGSFVLSLLSLSGLLKVKPLLVALDIVGVGSGAGRPMLRKEPHTIVRTGPRRP